MAMPWKEAVERAQAVAQLVVVAKTPFHVAVHTHGRKLPGTQACGSSPAFAAPGWVIAVDPEVDDVDGAGVWHGVGANRKKARQPAAGACVKDADAEVDANPSRPILSVARAGYAGPLQLTLASTLVRTSQRFAAKGLSPPAKPICARVN
jgi:hypothetical protein